MVGSDCSRIFCFSRLTNTAATRRALLRLSGLLLDQRGENDELFRRLDRQIGRMTVPDFLEHALLRLLHALDHLLARHAAVEIVGVGQQAAFARNFLDVAGQDVVVQQARDDLLGSQTFRNGELMRHHAALDDGRDDVAQAGVRLELIFAGLEIFARLEHEHAADKDPRLVDDAVAHQDIGDVANARAARNIDDAIVGQGPGSVETLLADHQRDAGHHRHQHEKVMIALPMTTKGCRARLERLGRHFDRVRLERGSRAARRQCVWHLLRDVSAVGRRSDSGG